MLALQRKLAFVIRYAVIAVMVVNALVPSVALAQPLEAGIQPGRTFVSDARPSRPIPPLIRPALAPPPQAVTATDTGSPTPSATFTPTTSATTPTPSFTPSATANPSPTPDFTPTSTSTASPLPTDTGTAAPTSTATASQTPSFTPTATASSTPTPSNTPTASPTASPTATPAPPEELDGANVLLYDNFYPDLFTGRARFSIPIWTPPGRNGLAPGLALTYSSATANGLLGDVQAPWAGMGWNIDTVEIARKITDGNCNPCGNGPYGYENQFTLLINGIGYPLIPDGATPGRYHTQPESFLYIQLHNDTLGNNTPAASNASGEWWEVVQRDGTRWRLGWNADSEQLAAMAGYPGSASGSWSTLGYAGHATDVVAYRWRADQVTDTHGNDMTLSYFEESRPVAGSSTSYDRASYLDTIAYTGGTLSPGYSVVFVRESRNGSDQPASPTDWDNWDTYRLNRIDVKHGNSVVRSYNLGYDVRSYTDDGVSWQTTTLTSLSISGGGDNLPTMAFTYVDKDNRANCGTGCQEWAYPRLASVSSGWGSTANYTYGNDGRPSTSWYNWRLESLVVADGVNPSPMTTTFSYSSPCYNDPTAGWCNTGDTGELVGYGQTSATTLDFDGSSVIGTSIHSFRTSEQKAGREYQVKNQNGGGGTLSQTNTTWTVSTDGQPAGGYFTFASAMDKFLNGTQVNHTEYSYDTSTGNLSLKKELDGTPTLYRQTAYSYAVNTSPSVWILNKVSDVTLQDAGGGTVSEQQFGYDGDLPGVGAPTVGELTLSRRVDGARTTDTAYVYDSYGNLTDVHQYKDYGVPGSAPSGAYLTYSIAYDTGLKTYPVSMTNPLSQTTGKSYDLDLGLPTVVTDANNNATATTYDGLGRVTSVTYPHYNQPNLQYTYPTPPVAAPFAVQAQAWDESASVYRSAFQIFDGLGRVIQTQGPGENAGDLNITDASYNAQGLTLDRSLPRTVTGTGGTYFAPSWGSLPHTVSSYDALGRTLSVTYADSSADSYSYSGLRTAHIDRNGHKKVSQNDAFGRLVKVEEYTGSNPYTLYATTSYSYDPRDLLTGVTDAKNSQTSIGYDGFGRKVSMSDPDMGAWSYVYDALGNLTTQTDARSCVTNVTYDDLNRPIGKTYSGPGDCATTPPVTYTYDATTAGNQGIGHRTGMSDGSGMTSWVYNRLGQVTGETRTIDGTDYTTNSTLDAFNRPLAQTLPSGEALNYGYNAMGALSSLTGTSTYVSNVHYNAAGQVTDQGLGNGLNQQYCYDQNTLRVTGIRAYSGTQQNCGTSPTSPVLDLTYSYQPNGNVSQMVDGTQNQTVDYTYDELDRLLSVTGPENKNYAYDTNGNIASKTTTPTITSVSAGGLHSCGLTAQGGVKCWGDNSHGELGDGTTTQSNKPVDVVGLSSGVVAISAGAYFSCALTDAGGVKCWGWNSNGQLGNGTTTDSNVPVDVVGLTSGVTTITAGMAHACALTTSGGAKCWGYNQYGQLGTGKNKDSDVPLDVSGLTSGVAVISAGSHHTCAVTTAGGAKCWGQNVNGELGDGKTKDSKSPVDVSGLTSGVATIAAGGYFTCAATTGGVAKCWGYAYGSTPVDVSGLGSGVSAVTAAYHYACALTTDGGAKCWGENNAGQLGDGTTSSYYTYTPIDVSGLTSGVAVISAGGFNGGGPHTCAVTTAGIAKCWGDNTYGELGNGTTGGYSATPVDVDLALVSDYSYGSGHAVTSLSTGESYTYDEDGNMITRTENGLTYDQTFDAENRLVSVTVNGQTTQFVYDGDGNLVKKIKPDGSSTIYIGKVYEVDKNSSGVQTRALTYYPAGGAMRIDSSVYYVLRDRLGSAYATTDSSGNVVGEMRYYASGETLFSSGSMLTDRLFTGQRWNASLGIYQFGARFYSPTLGRFLSADTLVPQPYNPQNLNRFSYVNNNPVNFTDPTGHNFSCGGGLICHDPVSDSISISGGGGTTYTSGGGGSGGGGGGGGGSSSGGGTPTATSTPEPTPTLCSVVELACVPTPTVTPTPYNGPMIVAPGPTQTPYPTLTPFAYGPVSTAVSYCFGKPDLSGAPTCGQMADQLSLGLPLIGVPVPLVPPGEIFDKVVSGSYFIGDITENVKISPPSQQGLIVGGTYTGIAVPSAIIPLAITLITLFP